jgi:uncharacterized membrane protein YcaP (DUF421 family)
MKEIFEWPRLLMNEQPGMFLIEVVFRSLVMFLIVFVGFRLSGKRSIKQLSVFEMVLIVSLGSAAGDPMFYEDVGLLPAAAVFVVVISLYRAITWLMGKSPRIETLIEGRPRYLIKEGKFCVEDIQKKDLAEDEFFSQLRVNSIEHLGQVRSAIVETSGEISVFYYEDDDVKPGLPLLPDLFNKKTSQIETAGLYACSYCAETRQINPGVTTCEVCGKNEWVATINTRRII